MQVIGLCRFSYPALDGFQITHQTLTDRRHYLYDTSRLAERFRLFETTTLPCFREQTDEEFELIVLIGDCLPKIAQERLQDLTADIRQVRIVKRKPARHRIEMQTILNMARTNPDRPCLQFRHDDDDAVSVDFIERLRIAVAESKGLMSRSETVGINFSTGFVARCDATGIQATQVVRPLLGLGLGMFINGNSTKTVFDRLHSRFARFMPIVTYPGAPMWVRTLHSFNDSPHALKDNTKLELLSPEQEGEFVARFAIDAQAVRQAFSVTPTKVI